MPAAPQFASRRTAAVPPPWSCRPATCRRWFITDDRGYVCPRDTFNYQTGCCDSGQLHSCET